MKTIPKLKGPGQENLLSDHRQGRLRYRSQPAQSKTHKATSRLACQSLQYLPELLLLLRRQAARELYSDGDNEVTALARLLALGHAEIGEPFCEGGACGAGTADVELLAINGLHSTAPASQCFFKVEVDGVSDVVAFAGEERMGFL